MPFMRPRPLPLVVCLAALLAGLGRPAPSRAQDAVATTDPTLASRHPAGHSSLFSASDAWYGAGAAAAVAIAGTMDRSAWKRASAPDNARLHHLADDIAPLGHPVVLAPAMILGWAGGRLLQRPELSNASVRVALSVGAAGVATEALKLAVGRMRPNAAPGDPEDFKPFSGDASFPSGHTTLAFATARALQRESRARWVPFVVYPIAAAVAWARVEEDKHWVSDVVAGAALGAWTADKAETFLRQRGAPGSGETSRFGLIYSSNRRATRLGLRMRF